MQANSFGQFVRQTRLKWGLTQGDFGKLCGLSDKYISGIERGHKDPPLATKECIKFVISRGKEQCVLERDNGWLPPSTDCTALVRAAADSKQSVTYADFLFLVETQLSLPSPMSPALVGELLKNRKQEKGVVLKSMPDKPA